MSQNPVYMGPNTVLRNADGTLTKVPAKGGNPNLQNPMYAISQLSSSGRHTASPPPLPPMRTGSRDRLLATPPVTPLLAFTGKEEHHYDTIPAFQAGVSPPPSDSKRTSGHYQHLTDTTDGIAKLPVGHLGVVPAPATMMASGKYDHLEGRDDGPTTQSTENPYVVDPSMPGVILPGAMVQVPPDSKAGTGKEPAEDLDVETIHLDMPQSTASPYDS